MGDGDARQNLLTRVVVIEVNLQACTLLERYFGDERVVLYGVGGTYRKSLKAVHDPNLTP